MTAVLEGTSAVSAAQVDATLSASDDQQARVHPRKRFRPLDGLRALAIGLVFAEHFGGWRAGTLGVDVFFVLSGYLITGLLVAEHGRRGSVSFRAFYGRRALRLMPAYLTMIGVTFVAVATIGSDESTKVVRQGLAQSLTYTGNIATAIHRWDNEAPRLWEFTWSLAAEEQFYLLWPIVLMIGLRLAKTPRKRSALTAFPLAVFLASAWWSFHLVAAGASVMRIAVAPDTRSSGLLLGCAVSLWESSRRGKRSPFRRFRQLARWSGIAIFAGVLALFSSEDAYAQARMSPLIAVATALLIVGLTGEVGTSRNSFTGAVLGLRPLAFIGRLSYSLYLYNILAILAVDFAEQQGLFHSEPGFARIAAVGAAIALALVSYNCVEQPFLRLRDRRSTRKAVSAVAV
ncbi:MAG: acyltransferase [Mycobacterium sp.]|nr:acyltransferase [Mycobacterium sp.]